MSEEKAIAVRQVPPPMDLAISEGERVEMWRDLFGHAAETMVFRDEHEDSPWVPQADDTDEDLERKRVLRQQEVSNREFEIIADTARVANLATMGWVLDHGDRTTPEGTPVELRGLIESLMPSEEMRASSGRARDLAAFYRRSVPIFREYGIQDQDIARAYAQGRRTYLGVVAAAQKALCETPEEESIEVRREKLLALIDAAEVAQSSYALKRTLTKVISGEDPSKLGSDEIPYTIENDGDAVWIILHMHRDAFVYRVLDKLREILVPSLESLAERFSQFWKAQQG